MISEKSVYSIFYMTNNILLLPYRVVHHCPHIPNHPGSPGSQNRRTATNEICTGLHRTVFVLGRDQGCTVKYNPLAEGVPQGEAQGNFQRQWVYVTIYPESSTNIDAVFPSLGGQYFIPYSLGAIYTLGQIQDVLCTRKYFCPRGPY